MLFRSAAPFDKGAIKDSVAESVLMQAKLEQRNIVEGGTKKCYVCAQCTQTCVYRRKKERNTIIKIQLPFSDYSMPKTLDDPVYEVTAGSPQFLTEVMDELALKKGVFTVFLTSGELIRHITPHYSGSREAIDGDATSFRFIRGHRGIGRASCRERV